MADLWSLSSGYQKFLCNLMVVRQRWSCFAFPLDNFVFLWVARILSWTQILDRKCWLINHVNFLLCFYIHLLLPLLHFHSVLDLFFPHLPLLAVRCVLYFNWKRKSLMLRCHMFNAIKRKLACVNQGVLYCMHLAHVYVDVPYWETIYYLPLSCKKEK